MIYKKYEGTIPYKVGDTVEFKQIVGNEYITRRGIIRRIDEFGDNYNMHIKCEYICPLGCGAVVYPTEIVKKIE